MSNENPVPQPKDTDGEWLRAFAEQYRNGTIKSVEGEYGQLIAIAAVLDALQKEMSLAHGRLVDSEAAVNAVDPPRQPDTLPSLTLEQINKRLGFTLSDYFIEWIGVVPVAKHETSAFYSEENFRAICAALKEHIDRVSTMWIG